MVRWVALAAAAAVTVTVAVTASSAGAEDVAFANMSVAVDPRRMALEEQLAKVEATVSGSDEFAILKALVSKELAWFEDELRQRAEDEEVLQARVRELESLREEDSASAVDYESGDVKGEDVFIGGQDAEVVVENDPALIHEDLRFLADLVFTFVSAAVCGAVAVALRIPMVVGFIFAGMIVGPSGFGLVLQMKHIDTLAEVGAALILFSQGLEFNAAEFKRFRELAAWAFIAQVCVNGMGYVYFAQKFVAMSMGGTEMILLCLSAALCSSTVAVNLAGDYQLTQTQFFPVLTALLVAQDFLMGLLLCIPEALRMGVWGFLIISRQLIYATALVSAFIWISAKILPRLSTFFLKKDVPQLFLLSSIAICLGSAFTTSKLGLSAEFGAFFAGLALTRTNIHEEFRLRIDSTRHLFSSILFASIGMLISPAFIFHNIYLIWTLFLFIFALKFLCCFTLVRYFGYDTHISLLCALSVAQIAEFSMILAGKGYVFSIISRRNYLMFLTVSVFTLFINPLIFKLAMTLGLLQASRQGRIVSVGGHSVKEMKLYQEQSP